MKRALKILYAAGPGDVINTYRHWVRGFDDPNQLAITYSGMFYQACAEHGDSAYVISTCKRKDRINDGGFLIVHRRSFFSNGPGPTFYIGQIWNDIRLIGSALWYQADVAVVACGGTSWGLLRILPLLGISVIPSLHCMLWSKHRKLTPLQRLFRWIRVPFFNHAAFKILSISKDVTGQLTEMTLGANRPIIPFTPCYRRRTFQNIAAPTRRDSFRVLFAGRINRSKGVFDLLSIAQELDSRGRKDISFDVCGDGPELNELKERVEEAGLSSRFRCHGHCNWQKMRDMYAEAHAVVVPTTGDFVEGFNKVVAEAVLAGRPAVTSDVCPALAYVRDAVVQVHVDDLQGYADAILKLCDEADFYEVKRAACLSAQDQFYDLDRSWMSALNTVLDEIRDRTQADTEAEAATLGIAN